DADRILDRIAAALAFRGGETNAIQRILLQHEAKAECIRMLRQQLGDDRLRRLLALKGLETQQAVFHVAIGACDQRDLGATQVVQGGGRVAAVLALQVRPIVIPNLEAREQRRRTYFDAILRRLGIAAGDLVPEAVLDLETGETHAPFTVALGRFE